ncbi:aquaporin [Microbacterium sp. USHLN186]|uniref:aquaporin n=1 Tax=Microbacterium sp. USHLN186 TaxID=3081286 RepID=UPI00301607DF
MESAMTEIPDAAEAARTARLTAEGFGSFLLVFAGVGTALFAADHLTDPGANAVVYLATALAFGLALLVAFSAFGRISGGHFNPAISLGAAAAGRLPWRDVPAYVAAQLVGAVMASTALVLIGTFGPADWLKRSQDAGFASTGFDALSPAGFEMPAAMLIEAILAAFLMFVYLGTTAASRSTPNGPAPAAAAAIGLGYLLVHLVAIPVDNGAVNPARSLATAIYGGLGPLTQLWVFLICPALGALAAGLAHRALFADVAARETH